MSLQRICPTSTLLDEDVARALTDPLADAIEPEVVEPMDRECAERLDQRIRLMVTTVNNGIEKLLSLVEEAKTGQIHVALGYASWGAYLADVGTIQVRLDRDTRAELANQLNDEGVSQRIIAALLGVGVGTVNRDLASGVPNGTPDRDVDDQHDRADATTTGTQDGKQYPKRRPTQPIDDEPVDRVSEIVEAARYRAPRCPDCEGPMGLTRDGGRKCLPCARAAGDVKVIDEFRFTEPQCSSTEPAPLSGKAITDRHRDQISTTVPDNTDEYGNRGNRHLVTGGDKRRSDLDDIACKTATLYGKALAVDEELESREKSLTPYESEQIGCTHANLTRVQDLLEKWLVAQVRRDGAPSVLTALVSTITDCVVAAEFIDPEEAASDEGRDRVAAIHAALDDMKARMNSRLGSHN